MILESRILGRKKTFESRALSLSRHTLTLGELIAEVVEQQVSHFNQQQEQSQTFQVLSSEAFLRGLEQGKITSGGQEQVQQADPIAALDVALTAFKDGLYCVFLDEEQVEDLGQTLHLQDHSRVLFVRLTPLVGG